MSVATNRLGRAAEDLAARHLQQQGYDVVERNWRVADGALRGEVDLVAVHDGVLVFVEVKSRRHSPDAAAALEAVTPAKQRQLRRLALAYLRDHGLRSELRFDVVGVGWRPPEPPVLVHVKAAF